MLENEWTAEEIVRPEPERSYEIARLGVALDYLCHSGLVKRIVCGWDAVEQSPRIQ